ncbi:MAG: lysylphosphatidylglycerol synthase transmembrane domain-containing protein [Candidatus Fermentibacter sp.]|nr:lysylphosphatidylglycerol synthase transmembrane domain-containing protein [Candidatus Fermentibacter sp.]
MKRALLTVFAALLVYTALVLLSDAPQFSSAISAFDPRWLPAVLGLPLVNYALRFLKWQYFLGRTGVRLPVGRSLLVFLAGFSMTVSPGKLGEVLKSCLLRDGEGIPVELTSPVVVAERITDLMSMVLLAVIGAILTGGAGVLPVVAAGIAASAAGVALVSSRRLFDVLSGLLRRIRFFASRRGALETFRGTCAGLLDTRSLLITVPLGVASWGAEAFVLQAAAAALGMPLAPGLAILSHSAGTIAGAVSMIPGGLGLTELTIGGLLGPALGRAGAAAVTIVMRFATLWFAVAVGLAALAVERARSRRGGTVGRAGCSQESTRR